MAGLVVSCVTAPAARAQGPIGVATPARTAGHTFTESFGLRWGVRRVGPGGGFFFNGPGLAPVPFGLGDPGGGARFGFAGGGNGWNYSFNMVAQQGSSRTNSVTAPTVLVPNGGVGGFSSMTVRPFVVGWIPVVGQQRISPLQERLLRLRQDPSLWRRSRDVAEGSEPPGNALDVASPADGNRPPRGDAPPQLSRGGSGDASSATHGDLSVDEIRRRRRSLDRRREQELLALIEKGAGAERQGKLGVAVIYFQQAERRAEGPRKEDLNERIERLRQRRLAARGLRPEA